MMKYAVMIRKDPRAVAEAQRIEGLLKAGKRVIAGECGSRIRIVAWPQNMHGEGDPMILMEGSAANCVRRILRCRKVGRDNFRFGWPKILEE